MTTMMAVALAEKNQDKAALKYAIKICALPHRYPTNHIRRGISIFHKSACMLNLFHTKFGWDIY